MKNRAFTLIELIIVIAIIALLTGIVMTAFNPAKSKSRDAKRISDLGQLQLNLELYFDRCREYPDPINTNELSTGASNGCPTGVTLGTYISTIPRPPTTADGTSYGYSRSPSKRDYVLHAHLENYNDVLNDGLPSTYAGSEPGWNVDAAFSCNPGERHYCIGPK
jgi:prepilin-type N-terminal cleavage/methylation domain-containing protein